MKTRRNEGYISALYFLKWVIGIAQTLLISTGLWGCQNQPINIERTAIENQWKITRHNGRHYPLVLLNTTSSIEKSPAHIYIEGDGLPWRSRTQVSNDPTPRNPVALNLMKYDDAHSIYLGRPCYFEVNADPRCSSKLWTSDRYSEEIVDEMDHAISNYLEKNQISSAVVIGYSGGGTLALLLANRNPRIQGAMMIAANFDTAAWVKLHEFTPLSGSLNPAREIKKRNFKEIYWFGENDTNVPPIPFAVTAKARSSAEVRTFHSVDHACCWEEFARSGELAVALQKLITERVE